MSAVYVYINGILPLPSSPSSSFSNVDGIKAKPQFILIFRLLYHSPFFALSRYYCLAFFVYHFPYVCIQCFSKSQTDNDFKLLNIWLTDKRDSHKMHSAHETHFADVRIKLENKQHNKNRIFFFK